MLWLQAIWSASHLIPLRSDRKAGHVLHGQWKYTKEAGVQSNKGFSVVLLGTMSPSYLKLILTHSLCVLLSIWLTVTNTEKHKKIHQCICRNLMTWRMQSVITAGIFIALFFFSITDLTLLLRQSEASSLCMFCLQLTLRSQRAHARVTCSKQCRSKERLPSYSVDSNQNKQPIAKQGSHQPALHSARLP